MSESSLLCCLWPGVEHDQSQYHVAGGGGEGEPYHGGVADPVVDHSIHADSDRVSGQHLVGNSNEKRTED